METEARHLARGGERAGDAPSGPAATRGPLLEVADLHITYTGKDGRQVHAVRGVDLTIRPGEVVGLLGESGSGKSSMGRAIAGFEKPSAGTIAINGVPSAGSRRQVGRAGVQMIFQDSSLALNPRLPIWKSVAEAIHPGMRRSDRAAAVAQLERVGLTEEQARKRPAEISGGQRQRVAIARALASGAKLIVCDEAVSALDVSVRATVLNLLARLRVEEDIALLFISHDIAVTAHLSDRIVVLHHGMVEEEAPTSELIVAPKNEYTRRLLDAIPALERGVSA
ncbi:ABC transporter ATP-binding protein [Microbacterium sp. No. 7]|uniref:ABC transporter ATP-binding protein n=1 Tax=Microbacterium sp. No. 7 TaxID=1714373 RepID=UPI0006D067EF|nr:ABC transporter ATP-binding protein [Microbacterium sp. No. 7]ALJ21906.1 hypothetical protein AOA12_19185 [Microbacterium sp. No. 7]